MGSSDRAFGLVFAGFFGLVSAWSWYRHGQPTWYLIAIGAVFLVLALTVPRVLAPLNRVWTAFGLLLHRVMNPVILAILYAVTIVPTGLCFRLLGKDPLGLRPAPNARSYWKDRRSGDGRRGGMRDQF